MTTQVPRRTGRATLETMTTAPHSASADPTRDDDTAAALPTTADSGAEEWPVPAGQWDEPDETTGSYDLEARGALRRVAGLSTELADVTEVEYRQLRLERVVLVGVWTEGTQADADRSLAELKALAETAGSEVLEAVSQRRDRPDAATYVGSGKATEIRDLVAASGADTVICDGELTPGQLNQLEKVLKVKVVDRTALILDIFAQHASSREGKAQVELAQMQYMLPRLRGWGESLSRQAGGRVAGGGGIGTRGPGETKIETDRRRIRSRVSKLRKEIAGMATARATQRASRDRNAVPSVAIAGYTNAGKSSLLNQLTGAGVLVENALFATLDPTVRRAVSPDGREFTLTDTVGFVRHLPHQLVDAFRSTLEEVAAADLLLHVVDGADPDPLGQIDAVRVVLGEIDALSVPEVIVVNKVDAMSEEDILMLRRALPGAVWVSARTGAGMDALRELIAARLPHPDVDVDVLVPYDRGDLVARVHRDGEVLSERHEESGTRLTARVDGALAATLEEFTAPVG
jgi:GTP-binding protein HflX